MPRAKPKPRPRTGPRYLGSVTVPLTVEEREALRAAAAKDSRPLSAWIRLVALREASR
jgi:hypothetical protein